MFVPDIYSAVIIRKFRNAAVQNCNVKTAILKILEILENFKETVVVESNFI